MLHVYLDYSQHLAHLTVAHVQFIIPCWSTHEKSPNNILPARNEAIPGVCAVMNTQGRNNKTLRFARLYSKSTFAG